MKGDKVVFFEVLNYCMLGEYLVIVRRFLSFFSLRVKLCGFFSFWLEMWFRIVFRWVEIFNLVFSVV